MPSSESPASVFPMISRALALSALTVLISLQAADRPQLGEAWSRNMTSPEINLPATFNPTTRDAVILAILSPASTRGPFLVDVGGEEPWKSLRG